MPTERQPLHIEPIYLVNVFELNWIGFVSQSFLFQAGDAWFEPRNNTDSHISSQRVSIIRLQWASTRFSLPVYCSENKIKERSDHCEACETFILYFHFYGKCFIDFVIKYWWKWHGNPIIVSVEYSCLG